MIFHLARRRTCLLVMVALLWGAILSQAALAATSAPVKRVLSLNSFPRDFSFFSALAPLFRSELARQRGYPNDFREVTLEAVKYAEGAAKLPLVEYLRDLPRWGISEARLPTGSIVRFRETTLWEQYHWYIVGALLVILLQAVLITGLVVNRIRRARGEAELRENQEVMEMATNAAGLGLWARDVVQGEVWANAALRSLYGFGQADLLRQDDLLARTHPEDSARVVSRLKRAQQESLPFEAEFRILLPEGKERWVLAKGRSVNATSGL